MFLPRLISIVRLWLPGIAAVLFLGSSPTALWAQDAAPATTPAQTAPPATPQPAQPQPVLLRDYSVPRSAFPHVLRPYMHQELAPPNLGNSPRIDSLMREGKIFLSIDDAARSGAEQGHGFGIVLVELQRAGELRIEAWNGRSQAECRID